MTLYDIDQQIAALFDEDTGELLDTKALDDLVMEREYKIGQIARACKNLAAEERDIEEEIKKLRARKEAVSNRHINCKNYLTYALNGEKYKDGAVSVSYRKSTAVVIDDGAEIPDEYMKHPAPEISKTALTAALNAGVVIPGVRLENRNNIQIR